MTLDEELYDLFTQMQCFKDHKKYYIKWLSNEIWLSQLNRMEL